MIIVEVRTEAGRVIEHRTFSVYEAAIGFFETARKIYEQGVSITFGAAYDLVH